MSKYRDESDELPRYAAIFRALGNPHRLAIFLHLVRCCAPDCGCRQEGEEYPCVGEFATALDLAPSTVSHHLKELTRAGLVSTERHGQMVHCWVRPETLADLAQFFLQRALLCPGISAEQVQAICRSWEAQ